MVHIIWKRLEHAQGSNHIHGAIVLPVTCKCTFPRINGEEQYVHFHRSWGEKKRYKSWSKPQTYVHTTNTYKINCGRAINRSPSYFLLIEARENNFRKRKKKHIYLQLDQGVTISVRTTISLSLCHNFSWDPNRSWPHEYSGIPICHQYYTQTEKTKRQRKWNLSTKPITPRTLKNRSHCMIEPLWSYPAGHAQIPAPEKKKC